MSEQRAGFGGGFAGLLTVLFIALKLTNHVTWSWVWVLSPMWISVGLGLLIFLISAIVITRAAK